VTLCEPGVNGSERSVRGRRRLALAQGSGALARQHGVP
jgi:hypothetical protein